MERWEGKVIIIVGFRCVIGIRIRWRWWGWRGWFYLWHEPWQTDNVVVRV
jgi:hypothetical protein